MKRMRTSGAKRLAWAALVPGLLFWLAGCAQYGGLEEMRLAATDSASAEPAATAPAATAPATPGDAAQAPEGATIRLETTSPEKAQGRPASVNGDETFSLAAIRERLRKAFSSSGPSTAQRQALGDTLAKKVLSRATPANDPSLQKRIDAIVARLARVAAQDNPWPSHWRVHILRDERPDAFTSGGGHLFITTGMIDLLQKDERIATVLAHEMGHNLLGHVWAAKEKKEMARNAHRFSKEVLAERMKLPWLGKSVSFVVNASLNTYSRQQEYDADGEGLDLLVRAGWKPQAALETFDYLKRRYREEASLKNFFYNNHPLYKRRRWYIENRIRAHYRAQAGLPPVRRANWKNGR